MKKLFLFFIVILFHFSCEKQKKADVIVINSNTYTVNNTFEKAEAFAIKDGKFIAVGTNEEIQKKYATLKTVDAKNQTIFPGLIDAHCHFYGLGLQQQKVDLRGTKSYDEVLEKLVAFQKEKQSSFITGRGWDQNDWEVKEFPTKEKLDKLFPTIPVAITRVDGHALLVNQAAIDISGITTESKVSGGEFIKKKGKLTGVFIDNAMGFIKKPNPTKKEQIQGLLDAQKISFSYGLTTVDDAGLSKETLELMDSLHKTGDLKMRIYGMVSLSDAHLDYYLNKGKLKTDRLNIRSFKVYGDGALGSRGAAMKEAYSDRKNHFGAMIYSPKRYVEVAKRIANSEYQMNTHAIGDSTNSWILKTYKNALKDKKDRRWRIEHAQIIAPEDFEMFDNIFPSIQPTHATSDMYWAKDRVGNHRIKGGYAYKDLLNKYGKVALGTDFPVEQVSPFLTFYAATIRKDVDNFPENGFQMENALTREETLKGMTIWAAYANFEENEKGSIEVGKFADFIILDRDIMKVEGIEIPKTKVISTFVNGEKVY